MDRSATSLLLLVAALLVLPVPQAEAAPPRGKRIKGKRSMQTLRHVILDPGHGGTNMGTPGAHGVHEKHLTLPIALEVERLLKKHTNARVTLTRRDDAFIGLRERTQHANRVGGDIFLSIHCNASPNAKAHGLEVYFLSADAASDEIHALIEREEADDAPTDGKTPGAAGTHRAPVLDQILREATMYRAHQNAEIVAGMILNTLHAVVGAPRRGVHQAPFGVLKEASMPAVVVEVGFSTHATEGKRLTRKAYQKQIALGLYRSLLAIDRRLSR